MKNSFVFSIFILLQCLNGLLLGEDSGLECITLIELMRTTKILCENQRNNSALWSDVIDCHRPMTDEFMRSSAEARCPNPKHVQDPTDTTYSMADVFFNICGSVQGSAEQIAEAEACMKFGSSGIMSHVAEVAEVKRRWGNDLPCKIGECIKKVAIDLGV